MIAQIERIELPVDALAARRRGDRGDLRVRRQLDRDRLGAVRRSLARLAALRHPRPALDLVHLNTSFDPKTVPRRVHARSDRRRAAPSLPQAARLRSHDSSTSGPRAVRLRAPRAGRASAIGVLSSEEQASFVAAASPKRSSTSCATRPMPSTPHERSSSAHTTSRRDSAVALHLAPDPDEGPARRRTRLRN